MSVVTEPRRRGENETDGVVGLALGNEIQSTGVNSIATNDAASRDGGENTINMAHETGRCINDISPSAMVVTPS